MKNLTIIYIIVLFVLPSLYGQKPQDTVIDIDGNIYHTVKIGTQVWMKENLNVTHYSNGDSIPRTHPDSVFWCDLKIGAYCDYADDSANSIVYGRLYNIYTLRDSRNLCPVGWHIPSDSEWTVLTNYLGGENVAGGKMKEAGNTHWIVPNVVATNSSGFTALPSGAIYDDDIFDGAGWATGWWSFPREGRVDAWCRYLMNYNGNVLRDHYENRGLSVRCIKD